MRTLNTIKYLGLFLILTSISITSVLGQTKTEKEGGVGIGTKSPDQSAILDLSSKSKGLLLPRMTLSERSNIIKPAPGLMVYQTNLLSGLYVYDGKNWSLVNNTSNGAKLQTNEGTSWSTSGNAGLNGAMHFLGTTDTTSLIFKVNNFPSGTIDFKRGMTSLGFKAASITRGYNSVVLGALALQKANTGGNNIAIGYQTMFSNEKGDHNVAIGSGVLAANQNSEKNTAVGSLAGYKATGNSNVFLGFQAGYFETGSNKLHISNDASRAPLIFGDFESGRVGINTTTLNSVFNINGVNANNSGLRFEKLNSNSPAQNGNRKVLALNSNGEVILVSDYYEPKASSFWNLDGNNISNNNGGIVNISNDLDVKGGINTKGLRIGNDGISIPSFANGLGKFLGVDANGKVQLVDAPIAQDPGTTPTISETYWTANGNEISNSNGGIVGISNGLKFGNLNNSSAASGSNGKVLSLDENGNVILVNDQKGDVTITGSDSGFWKFENDRIQTTINNNVKITNGLEVDGTIYSKWFRTMGFAVGEYGMNFTSLNSNSATKPANGKVLSLDENGFIILVPAATSGTTTPTPTTTPTITDSHWGSSNGVIYTQNNDKVVIGEGINSLPDGFNLYVRKGILAERVRVAVANSEKWADYVFDRNYQLMPIKDVAKFIEANKHLPNVPSAEEVAANGIDMAEIAAKQMEKIEELTLYMIQANERIEKLENEVKNLRK